MTEDNKDLRKQRREEMLDEKRKYSQTLIWKLDDMEVFLNNQKGFFGRSDAYHNLVIALRWMQDQGNSDKYRYQRRLEYKDMKEEMQELQQALNRERKLRQELENKITEATTSSGLFIKYVRDKLGV